jgi:aminomethyltransferase
MVDFAGWSMPVQYSSIVAEHNATRKAAALFDVSHMGRLFFSGTGAAAFLDGIVTRRISDMELGQVRYGLVTNDQAGILDDVLVYRLMHDGDEVHLMVVNASNREKIVAWVEKKLAGRGDVKFADMTTATAMIAVQGRLGVELLKLVVAHDLAAMKYYTATEAKISGKNGIVSRTGYTGEDGYELIVPSNIALGLWEKILADGKEQGVIAAGLGARDTLRLEAAMPLYGHELNEEINPLEAGLGFAVNLEGRTFPGSDKLAAVKRDGSKRVRVGLQLSGKRVPREHYGIFAGDGAIGEVTSGTFSPTLEKPIAMGYISPEHKQPGTKLLIDIRGSKEPAEVVKLPFYKRTN